jgi:hypothetical protein
MYVGTMEQPAGPPAAPLTPVFRFECAAGCHPVAAGQCRRTVLRAILDAINFATGAQRKLEATPRDAETIRLFRFFFGHDPSRPVTWAGNQQSGRLVALRFRMAAESLMRRGILFRCGCHGAGGEARARTNLPGEPNVVELCNRFWNPPPGLKMAHRYFRAGVVLHETLHILFRSFFHHPGHPSGDPVRRRDNPHCYEAFAMRLAGHAADPSDVRQCREQPA